MLRCVVVYVAECVDSVTGLFGMTCVAVCCRVCRSVLQCGLQSVLIDATCLLGMT